MTYQNELNDLYDFWFSNQNLWFNATSEDDENIRLKFGDLFLSFDFYSGSFVKDIIYESLTQKESIAYIILMDQISRHICRENTVLNQIIIQNNLNKIIPFVKKFYEDNHDKLSPIEFSFVLLPLRHTKSYLDFLFVIQETWKKIKSCINDEDKSIYMRFITASYERYVKYAFETDKEQIIHYLPQERKGFTQNIKEIIDTCCNYEELFNLDFGKNQLDSILSHLDKDKTYILSLSGGVDSMVLSYLLKSNNFKFVGVHISYQNRPECQQEIDFMKEWCDILNISLYYRKIIEINRKDCMEYGLRELYESYTRDIRFNTYKIVGEPFPRVFLGHNKDDRFENILTNIASQSHYDNLTGMEIIQNMSGIEFHRPLLNTAKSQIYEFTHSKNIYHLQNSTPAWSQRGKIRDRVKPALSEWNPVIIDSFFKLSNELASYVDFIKQSSQIAVKEIKKTGQLVVNIKNVCFLESYWNNIFKEQGIWISTKSSHHFIEKLKFIKNKFEVYHLNELNKINLSKSFQIKFKKINNVDLIILFI
jgi:tRNA(Ile)-lysidine synthetase-like protein